MMIYKALLKYGYAEFRLEILEYCYREVLIEREQFYFDTLIPEYNILKIAGSPLGYRHSEASKKLISMALKNIKVSESTRELKREALLGKVFDKVRIEKMRISNTFRKPVQITNTETGEVLDFASLTDAGYYLGISRITVSKYLLNNLTYNKYTISAKGPLSLPDKEILDESSRSNSFTGKISHQLVLLTNKETGDKKEFSCMVDAAKYLGISNGRLWYFFNKTVKTGNETLKGYTISKLSNTKNVDNKTTKMIEVTDLDTNEINTYPSISLAGKALGISLSSAGLQRWEACHCI
jgi:group I intron endonuclease